MRRLAPGVTIWMLAFWPDATIMRSASRISVWKKIIISLAMPNRTILQLLPTGLALALALLHSTSIAQERRIVLEPALGRDSGTLIAMNSAFVAVLTRPWTYPFPPSRLQMYRRDDVVEPVLDRLVPLVYIHKLVMSEDILAVGIETEFLLYRRIGTRWFPAQSISGEHVAVESTSVVTAACDAAKATGCQIRTYSLSGPTPVLEDEFSLPHVFAVALAGGTLYVSELSESNSNIKTTSQIRSYTRTPTGHWEPLGLIRPKRTLDGFKYGSLLIASPDALVIERLGAGIYDGTGNEVSLDVTNAPRAKTGTSRTFVHPTPSTRTDPEVIRFRDEQSKAVLASSKIFVLRNGNLDHFLLDGRVASRKKPSIAKRWKKEGRRAVTIAGTSNGIAIVVEKPDGVEREVWIESF